MSFLLLTNSASIRFFLPRYNETSSVTSESHTVQEWIQTHNYSMATSVDFFKKPINYTFFSFLQHMHLPNSISLIFFWIFNSKLAELLGQTKYVLLKQTHDVKGIGVYLIYYKLHWEFLWKNELLTWLWLHLGLWWPAGPLQPVPAHPAASASVQRFPAAAGRSARGLYISICLYIESIVLLLTFT